MKQPLRRPNQPNQEEPAPTTPRWPPPYGEGGAQQDYGQQGHAQPQGSGYYFPQAAPQGFAQQPPAQHGSLPFNRLPPGGDAGHDYAGQAPGQSLPFNRFPQAAQEPEPNYGFSQHGAEPAFAAFPAGPAHQQAAAAPPWSQQQDPRGFDLGAYAPAAGQAAAYQHAEAGPDPGVYGGQHPGYAETDSEFDDAFLEEEEPPAGGRRGLMIVAALVGAIGLGGGMAYTYKTFFAPRSGPAVVIKDTQGPAKSKPEVADGRGFPHTDKKLLSRLGEDATRPPPAADAPANADASGDRGDDPNGPRRVRTIQIMPGQGGSGGPSPAPPPVMASAAPPPAGPPGIVTVPGVTLENFGTPRPPPQAAPRPSAPPQQQAQPPSAARVEQPPAAAAPPARPAQPPVRAVAATPPPAAAPAAKEKAAVPKAKQPAAGSLTGAGYVAVLSSKKTRMDALKVIADTQQKYGDVLSSKTPDVQEADLGEKGVWYRAVVGPPGSREAALNLCSQLKNAGHEGGCWVTAY
jgi:hypothetical protein